MSEQRAMYNTGTTISPQDLATRPCCLPYADPGYRPPTPEEVSALIKGMGWSQNDAAKICGANYNPDKGSTTVRRWQTPASAADSREIPYAAWRLLLINAGLVREGGQYQV